MIAETRHHADSQGTRGAEEQQHPNDRDGPP
jgi:hypothetical protein